MEFQYSDRLKNLNSNAIRAIFKYLDNPLMISFAGGLPATSCLPVAQFNAFIDEILTSENAAKVLQYGSTEGYLPLRKALIPYVKRCGIEGIEVDNVLIVSGGQQGIDLTYKLFVNKGDVILFENPTYLAALHIARTYEAQTIGVNSDADGIDLNDLEEKIKKYQPKVFYIVPNFSNPTGKTLPVAKRKAIAALTAKYGVMVIEDDPYRELRYVGEPLPSIKSFDKTGNVIYNTSFSKTIAPAMRVGAVIADPAVVAKLAIGKQAVDVHTVTLMQAVAERFIRDDTLDRQVAKSLPIYREKLDAMLVALDQYMPDSFTHTVPDGGLFIWGEFSRESGISAKAKFQEALALNIAYVCGNDFLADGSGSNCIRLNFSNATLEQIEVGVQRLGALFKK